MEDDDQGTVWPPAPARQEAAGSGAREAKTRREVRLFGVFLFLAGLALAWWIKTDVDSGMKVSGKIVIATPAVLLMSLAFVIEPRIMLANMKGVAPQPAAFKVIGYAVGAVGVAIGFYILFTFFNSQP